MTRPKIEVKKRTLLGKKVKKLRKNGLLPANIYGKGIKSLSVELPVKEFEAVFKDVGETSLLDVAVDGQLRPVLIHNIQRHPVSGAYLHADFYQVNLKEKIKSMIPVDLVGEPEAVTNKAGLLLQTLQEIEVEALPEKLPERFEVAVEKLTAVDDHVTVGDIKASEGVEILTDPSQVIAKISELITEEAKEQAAQEAAASEAAKESAEGVETPTPPEEESKEQPQTPEEKPQEEQS